MFGKMSIPQIAYLIYAKVQNYTLLILIIDTVNKTHHVWGNVCTSAPQTGLPEICLKVLNYTYHETYSLFELLIQ